MTTNVSEKADSSFVELASIHTGGDGLNSTEKTLLERIESLERSKADTERVLLERIEALEQQPKGSTSENEPLIQNEEKPPLLTDSAISRRADTWELPESTYTLLIAEKVMSVSFTVGLVASAISLMSLIIVLVNELDNGTDDNPFGLPAGVSPQVRMAQFLGESSLLLLTTQGIRLSLLKSFFVHRCYYWSTDGGGDPNWIGKSRQRIKARQFPRRWLRHEKDCFIVHPSVDNWIFVPSMFVLDSHTGV